MLGKFWIELKIPKLMQPFYIYLTKFNPKYLSLKNKESILIDLLPSNFYYFSTWLLTVSILRIWNVSNVHILVENSDSSREMQVSTIKLVSYFFRRTYQNICKKRVLQIWSLPNFTDGMRGGEDR